jgi:hypothetical protein
MTDRADGTIFKWPLESLGASVSWFRAQLASAGVNLHPRSAMRLALERLDTLRGMALANVPFRTQEREAAYDFFSDAIGADFLTKTLHRGVSSGLQLDRDRWHHCVAGDPIVTRPGSESDDRNRLWETVMACVIATFAARVKFEEPDVVCDYEGASVGVAAKFSRSSRKLWKNVGKGASQARSRADVALIGVNVIDILPVKELFVESTYRGDNQPSTTVAKIKEWAIRWCDRPELQAMATKLRDGNQVVGVAFFMPLLVMFESNPVPFFYTHMPLTWADGSADFSFARSFLQACHTVLGFGSAP